MVGGDGHTKAGRRVLSGGNLNLQTRQSGNGAWAGHAGRGRCVVGGAARGWDRVARGSTEAQVARAGLGLGLQAPGGRYEVPVRKPALGTVQCVWPPSRCAAAQEDESSEGGSSAWTHHPFPPSLAPHSLPPGLLDPCGLYVWPERDQRSVEWIPG